MRAVLILARAELRGRWRGWLAAAALVALAGGVVLTTAAGARRTDTAYPRFLRASGGADVLIAPTNTDIPSYHYYAAVAKLPGVAIVAPVVGLAAVTVGTAESHIQLLAAPDARLGRLVERPKFMAGRMADPARVDEAVADRFLAAQLHLTVGSVLHLLFGPSGPSGSPRTSSTPRSLDFAHATALTVRVVGLGINRDDVVPVNALASVGSLLVSPAVLRGLSPDRYAFDGAYIRLHRGASVVAFGQQAQALAAEFPETGGQVLVANEHEQAAKVNHAIHPQAVALALFALLTALTGLLIVGQVLVRQVFVASADHPALRALGLTRDQLVAVGLVEVVAAAAAGAAMAVVIAVMASPLMPIGPARIAEPHPGVAFNWALLGSGGAAMVVLFGLRVTPSLWRLASQGDAAEAAPATGGVERRSRLADVLTRTGVPVSGSVGARMALEPGRGRTAVPTRTALAGSAVAVAAVAAAFTFGTSLVRLVNTPRLYGQTWQVSIDAQFGQLSEADVEAFLRRQGGVSGWTLGAHGDAIINGLEVASIGLTPGEGPPLFPTLLEGRAPQTVDEIALGTKTLALTHRRVGQTVMVAFPGGTARPFRVVGRAVFPFFGLGNFTPTGLGDGAAVLDPRPDLTGGLNFALVAMAPGPGRPDNIARFARNLKASGICPAGPAGQGCHGAVTAQRPADVSNYARIKSTPLVLAGILAVLALATVTHFLVTSIRRRRRDLAVLRTLGFVRRQVSAAVAWQASIVVVLALLVGLPLGVAAGRWVWLVLATRLGVAPEPQIPLPPLLVSVPVALAIANAVAAVPGWMAGRLLPGPVLRTE